MVVPRGARDTSQGNLGGNIAARQEETTKREEHAVEARGDTLGAGEWVFVDVGTETGDSQVGREPLAEAGNPGTETGNAQVGGVTYTGVGAGAITSLVLGASGWGDGDRRGDWGQGGVQRSREGRGKTANNNKRHSLRL